MTVADFWKMRGTVIGRRYNACPHQTCAPLCATMRRFALAAILSSSAVAELIEHPEHGIRLERGFEIIQFSDEKLANDIWCMTLNPRGEVVVSGPGYVSTLL